MVHFPRAASGSVVKFDLLSNARLLQEDALERCCRVGFRVGRASSVRKAIFLQNKWPPPWCRKIAGPL
jgi:hypothetical protein